MYLPTQYLTIMHGLWFVTFSCLLLIKKTESESCTSSTGFTGQCIPVQTCAYAINLLKTNKYPEVCNFDGNISYVCCPQVVSNIGGRPPGKLSYDKCGEYYSYYGIYVFKGKKSKPREFPHMALIGFDGEDQKIEWLCGGSLISRQFVLTAAHCLRSSNLGPAKHVRLGDLDLSTDTDEADPQQFKIIRSIPHPDYEEPSKYNDIALVELDRPIKKTEYVSMACLDTVRQHKETVMAATGWGKVEFQGYSSSFLLKADVDVSSHAKCRVAYNSESRDLLPRGILENMMICAGNNKSDTCMGDSGGPLQVLNRAVITEMKVYNIVGVTSFGKVCGISNAPGVYTRVFNYLDWIEKTVWPNE